MLAYLVRFRHARFSKFRALKWRVVMIVRKEVLHGKPYS